MLNTRKTSASISAGTILEGKTSLGQAFDVSFENGVKVLNSENANYSFGSLHQIMQKGIVEVLGHSMPANILMLGLGGGSALAILSGKLRKPYKVTAIEIDADLVEIAGRHFGLDRYDNLSVICGDACHEIRKLPAGTFDLIIDDIFWDNRMPDFCLQEAYLSDNMKLLSPRGTYMRNTMTLEPGELRHFENNLQKVFGGFYSKKHPEYGNMIYFCQIQPK
jgi:spermidine synthase